MIRRLVRSVIHNATVTEADAGWPVSLRVDPILLHAAAILPFEEIEVISAVTGERFATFAEPGSPGEVRVHAGTAHHVRARETISNVSNGLLHDGQTLNHRAKVVTVDTENRVVALDER